MLAYTYVILDMHVNPCSHAVKLVIKYDNGEEEQVDIKRVEPAGDQFEPVAVGDMVCCKAKGGRFEAEVLQIVERTEKKVHK